MAFGMSHITLKLFATSSIHVFHRANAVSFLTYNVFRNLSQIQPSVMDVLANHTNLRYNTKMILQGVTKDAAAPVVVALSGGVDSAVCAGLLVESGYPVVGISMRLYNAQGTTASSGGRCCGPRDLEDARAVCAHLGIPYYVANYEEEFEKSVIDDFVRNYQEGKTPNPCVRCNQHIKFTPLLYRSKALGASALCTGHYAKLEHDPHTGEVKMFRGLDAKKDQSYFLFGMPRNALPFVHFPLGGLTKEEVRAHAIRLGLPNANKQESQEICFVPDGDQAGFVAKKAGLSKTAGEIVDGEGTVVGTHEGVHKFTVGQRRGIGVGLGEKSYVVSIDALKRRVQVGPREQLAQTEAFVEEVSWFSGPKPVGTSLSVQVQIRYRHKPQDAVVSMLSETHAHIRFVAPEFAVAPGQAAVFYRDDEVLGGGFLSASPQNATMSAAG